MPIFDCIVLTDNRYLKDSNDAYKHNVFYEDQLLVQALKSHGLAVERLAWDHPSFNWSTTQCIVFRTTWDYFDRFDVFSTWLNQVSKVTQLINSEALIRWNLDKHYLQDLDTKGIPIPETEFIKQGTLISLRRLHERLGWSETVLKPCISGAGRHTYLLKPETIDEHEAIFKTLLAKESMMLQPFQHNIVNQGEISMMVFNGLFSHAVLKKAKPGDFRVQDDFGGTVHDYSPSSREIEFAENAAKACPELPIYARVDIFYDNNDDLAVSELELIEPELWFRFYPRAAMVLAKIIKEKLNSISC